MLVLLGLPGLIALGLPATGALAATPLCFGKPPTIVGTAGPDRLVGQSGVADVIWGGGGDDYISEAPTTPMMPFPVRRPTSSAGEAGTTPSGEDPAPT